MYYLDLFSGIGGFALGAYWAGWRFDESYFSDVDDYCNSLYSIRFPDSIPLGDIKGILASSLPQSKNESDRWVVTGGFPCQDISIAGKGEGIEGERSGLWFEMWRIIRDLRPRWVIAENVGAITFRGLSTVLNSLAEIGYDAEWQDIRASDMGAPHRRERIWIVAYPAHGIMSSRRNECIGVTKTNQKRQTIRVGCSCTSRGNTDVADTSIQGFQNRNARKNRQGTHSQFNRENCRHYRETWAVEPNVGRVAHGIPHRVDRLKALGNSIVPQIAELLFRRIAEIDENNPN